MILKFRETRLKIDLIQTRFFDQILTKNGKVEVLINKWNKLLGQLQLKATKF